MPATLYRPIRPADVPDPPVMPKGAVPPRPPVPNQYHPPGFSVHRRGGENSPRSDDDDDPIYTGHSTWSAGGYIKIWQPAKGVASVTMQNDLPQTLPKIALPSEAGAAEPLVPPSIDADVLTCTGCCGRTKYKKQETLRTVYI